MVGVNVYAQNRKGLSRITGVMRSIMERQPPLYSHTRSRALEQQVAFAVVPGHRSSSLEFAARLGKPPELLEKIAADAGQQMIAAQCRILFQSLNQFQPSGRAASHRHSHSSVEFDYR